MRILITGGTVFVSRLLAEHFILKGNEVFVLNRGTHEQPKGAHLIKADRYDIGQALKEAAGEEPFDAVIAVNTYDENDMAELLRALSCGSIFNKAWLFKNFVFISSSAVYPEVNQQPFKEEQQTGWNQIWKDYGLNKAMAEDYLKKRVKDAYILRPPYFYGDGNNIYREAFVFDCAVQNRPFYVPEDGQMKLQFYSVFDLCVFIEKLLKEKPENKIFNLGNQELVTIKEWVSLCYKVSAVPAPEFISVLESVSRRNYFPFYKYEYKLDVQKEMEFCPPSEALEDGLRKAFEWYKNHEKDVMKKPYFDFIDGNLK